MKFPTQAQYDFLLRHDLASFAGRCFQDLNPQTCLAINWHLELIAAKLTAVREGRIRRLIINLPPRHLKSLPASIAFPAWCLASTLRRRSSASAMPRNSPTSSPAIAAAS
jgi:hypothetical protein